MDHRTSLTSSPPLPPVASIGRHRIGRGHGDHRAGGAGRQRMAAQHQVRGHDLGQARDGHRRAAAVRAEQAGSGQPDGGFGPAGPVWAGRGPGQHPHRGDRGCQGSSKGPGAAAAPPPGPPPRPRLLRPRSAIATAADCFWPQPGAAAHGGRPAASERTVPSLTARGRNCLRRMTHHRNNDRPPGIGSERVVEPVTSVQDGEG
jgi:hypothetical protein